jgi:pyrroloquinoline quinone biosynthesis protein E
MNKVVLETPKPNKLHYDGYRLLGLLAHPRRLLNALKYRASKLNPRVTYYPLTMDIEPTQRCNYRCVMCDPASLFKERRKDMKFDDFKRVIDEQHGLIEVKIQGVGEPLLSKDFMKMVNYALGKRLWVRSTINGSLLHKEDLYKQLIDSGIHDLNISCDGASAEVYEKIRKGGEWETFKQNARLINDYNAKTGNKVPVRAWVVAQKDNWHELFDFPATFAALGFREMCISFAMHNYGRDEKNDNATELRLSDKEFQRLIDLGKQHGIATKFWSYPTMTREKFCKIPFNRIYLTTDLHVVPCCYIANQEIVDMGSYDQFKEIWFDKYVAFRESHKDPSKPLFDYCQKCYGGQNEQESSIPRSRLLRVYNSAPAGK